jgi:hypothetical protein
VRAVCLVDAIPINLGYASAYFLQQRRDGAWGLFEYLKRSFRLPESFAIAG